MRRLVVCLLVGGCALAPDDAPLAPLERLSGAVQGDSDEPVEVMITWHRAIPASTEQPPWLEGQRTPVVNGRFDLGLSAAPPAAAQLGGLIPDWFSEEYGDDVRIAFGHMVAYSRFGAEAPGWQDLFEGDIGRLLAVNNERILLWWSGPAPDPDFVNGDPIRPGYNVLELEWVEEWPELTRVPTSGSWDLSIDPDNAWVIFERCRPDSLWPNPLEVWVSEGDEIPPHGSCVLCDRGMQTLECIDVFGLICNCWNPRLLRIEPDDVPSAWPCGVKEGQDCPEDGQRTCSINTVFACEGGKWVGQYSCNLDECCDPGCGPNEDFQP